MHQESETDRELDKILDDSFAKHFRNIKGGYYKDVWLPREYLKIADDTENFVVRDDDVWVCSFPRSGNTWTQEMVWCICNDRDFEKCKISLSDRYFYLEFSGATTLGIGMVQKEIAASKFSFEYANQLPSPRFFKCHLPYQLLPKDLRMGKTKAKIVYISRNPKDVCISYYHLRVDSQIYFGTFENYCRLFLENRLAYTPYWENLISYWEAKDSNNILFLKFENMKKDLTSVIKAVASFFDKTFTIQQIATLCDYLSFDRMKSNTETNSAAQHKNFIENTYDVKLTGEGLIRKGKSDQWKTDMSEELIKKFDIWMIKYLKEYPDLRAYLA